MNERPDELRRRAVEETRLVVPASFTRDKLLEDIAAVQHECDLVGSVAPTARKLLYNYLDHLRERLAELPVEEGNERPEGR